MRGFVRQWRARMRQRCAAHEMNGDSDPGLELQRLEQAWAGEALPPTVFVAQVGFGVLFMNHPLPECWHV